MVEIEYSMTKKILVVIGTRPEAIKMAPLIKVLSKNKSFELAVCSSGQHEEMLDDVINIFDLNLDFNLKIMKPNQSLNETLSKILVQLKFVLTGFQPDLVVVHGDTATTLGASLASYFEKVPVAHVEAGLRTDNIYSPWPEEGNRKIVGAIADLHFAPTETARLNLLKENICSEDILVTGNTVIDSLDLALEIVKSSEHITQKISSHLNGIDFNKKIILVTCHRRDNYGPGFKEIAKSLKSLVANHKNISIVLPLHLNPNVSKIMTSELSNIKNIILLGALDYLTFIYLMQKSYLILTDSGGIQEEAPSLGKPVLVMRDTTERPEAVNSGTAKLIGSNAKNIIENVTELITDPKYYKMMSSIVNPYGDGTACFKIEASILKYLSKVSSK